MIYENHPKHSSEHQEFGPTDHSTSFTWRAGWPQQWIRQQSSCNVKHQTICSNFDQVWVTPPLDVWRQISEPACVCGCLPDWTTISTRYKRGANDNVSVLKNGSLKKEIMLLAYVWYG
jgi:hypothetical protein